jgi:hypothetical protein
MRMVIRLRLENNQLGNIWYSDAEDKGDSELQVHMSHDLYVVLGKPKYLNIDIEHEHTRNDALR